MYNYKIETCSAVLAYTSEYWSPAHTVPVRNHFCCYYMVCKLMARAHCEGMQIQYHSCNGI